MDKNLNKVFISTVSGLFHHLDFYLLSVNAELICKLVSSSRKKHRSDSKGLVHCGVAKTGKMRGYQREA